VLTATAPFHTGEVGVGYAPVALAASGGVEPYKWSISAGALPDGLTLGTDGRVSGNPTTAGVFAFTVQVADTGTGTASIPGSIPIAAALSANLIPACATQCSVELGCVNVCGTFGQMGGGVGPYSYALRSGQLPAGTTLSGLTLTGTFTGLSGYLRFSVQVTDSQGASASVAPTFWMYQHLSLASGICTGNFITGCSVRLSYSGGIGTASVKLVSVGANPNQGCWPPTATQPPVGYGLSVSGGAVVVSIPKGILSGYGAVWTLQLADQGVCASNTNCTAPLATLAIGVQCG